MPITKEEALKMLGLTDPEAIKRLEQALAKQAEADEAKVIAEVAERVGKAVSPVLNKMGYDLQARQRFIRITASDGKLVVDILPIKANKGGNNNGGFQGKPVKLPEEVASALGLDRTDFASAHKLAVALGIDRKENGKWVNPKGYQQELKKKLAEVGFSLN